MILPLFGVLIAISLVFILIGLIKPDESAMALVGFVFLFLLSFVVLNGSLEFQVGNYINTTYGYDASDRVNFTSQAVVDNYQHFSDSNSHTMGYYLVIISVVGFVGVLLGLQSTWKRETERREANEEQ